VVYWKERLEACYALADKKQHPAFCGGTANETSKCNSQMIL
jgi:hypothetical protein